MKTFFKILLGVVVLSIFVYTIYFLYEKSQAKPVQVETTHAFIADNIIKKTVATGAIVPRKEVEIKPQVSGIIDELFVEPGDMVKKGDMIAKIMIIPNMVNLNNAESRLNRAQINFNDAERDFNRQKELLDQGVIARAEFEDYEVAYISASEEVESAQNNLQLIKEGQTTKTSKTTNTVVRSTIEGMILDVPVKIGSSVIESNNFNEGTTIVSVADMADMIFEGKIDETEVGKIIEGMSLILTIGAIDDASFEATLKHISPKGVEENGAIQFEIKADVMLQESFFIRSGYSANADIVLARVDSVLAISENLLQFEDDSAYVEVETSPQQFEKRFIETGLSDGINIEVISGLTEDENIKKPSGMLK